MNMRHGWPAYACIAVFSLCAALFLASDLGLRQVEQQQAAQTRTPISVYPKGEPGSPELTAEWIDRWQSRTEIKCALPVILLPVSLTGYGYSIDVVLSAVPEDQLAETDLSLSTGSLPDSAWEPEMILGSSTAQKIAESAGQLPSHTKLLITGPNEDKIQTIPVIDFKISGTALPTGTASDDGLWIDTETLQTIAAHQAFFQEQGISVKPVRADVYLNNTRNAATIASDIEEQGFLAVNPLQDWNALRENGAHTRNLWGFLSLITGVLAFFSVRRFCTSISLMKIMAGTILFCILGMSVAVALMQTAMLLGWDGILDNNVRYMLDFPRCIAALTGCLVIAFSAISLPHSLLPRNKI